MRKAIVAILAGIALLLTSNAQVNAQDHTVTGDSVINVGTGTTTMPDGSSSDTVTNNQNIEFQEDVTLTISGDNSGTGSGRVTEIGNITTATNNTGTLTFNLNAASQLGVDSVGANGTALKTINVTSSGDSLIMGRTYVGTINIADNQFLMILGEGGDSHSIGTVNLNDTGGVNLRGGNNIYEVGTITGGVGTEVYVSNGATVNLNGSGSTFGKLTLYDNRENTVNIMGDTTILYGIADASFSPIFAPFSNRHEVVVANGATLTVGGYSEVGNFTLGNSAGGGTLVVGDLSGTAPIWTDLYVGNWTSKEGSTVRFGVDRAGTWSSLIIYGNIKTDGAATITLRGSGSLEKLGDNMAEPPGEIMPGMSPFAWLVVQDGSKEGEKEDFEIEDFRTSRYDFRGHYFETNEYFYGWRAWGYHVQHASAIPDLAPQIVVNIVGFELPRAQYADGLWVRTKGGTLNDNKSTFSKNSYQFVQVGWDKIFDARNGVWNAGIFMEGNWMYGSGDYAPWRDEVMGKLSSTHTGVGAGLYLGREFRNQAYVDVVGRVTQFGNTVQQVQNDPTRQEENYSAEWANQMFAMAIEVGRTSNSRDNRYSLNVFNRLLYNSASANEFSVNYEDGSYITAHVNGFGGWTNRVGGRLTFNQLFGKAKRKGYYGQDPCESLCDPCDPCGGGGSGSNTQLTLGADWYQGLSGKFGASFSNPHLGIVNQSIESGRTKNDMSYGTASVGLTVRPLNWLTLNVTGESLFGDVNGYGAVFMTKMTF